MKATWPAATARRLGMSGEVSFSSTRVGLTLHIPCDRGRHIVDVRCRAGLNPNGIAKMMLNQGWTVGSKPICPSCGRKEKKVTSPQNATTKPRQSHGEAVATPKAEIAASDAARKAHRMVMMALEDYYDEAAKTYRQCYNDKRIAEETGASEAHVRQTRESYFGPLGEPAEIQIIRDEIAALRTRLDEITLNIAAEIGALQSRLRNLSAANGWRE
jgi:hypothetical protein